MKALVLKAATPRDRSEQEIAGYRDALNLIHESHPHMPFTANVVLQLHSMLFRYLPSEGGRWKATDNEIVDRGPDGRVIRVRFKPTPAVAMAAAIDDLVTYISLERIVEETKETYYQALEHSSQRWHRRRHDVRPWLDYFWGTLLRAYREFEERVGTLLSGRGSKSRQVRDAVSRRLGPFTISDIEADCPGVSRDTVRTVLRQMRDEGAIAVSGAGRGARWRRSRR